IVTHSQSLLLFFLVYTQLLSLSFFFFFFLIIRRPPRSTLFPYTTSSDLSAMSSTARIASITLSLSACHGERHPSRSRNHEQTTRDRKSTRLNSSHVAISYAVFCLKKKKKKISNNKQNRRKILTIKIYYKT